MSSHRIKMTVCKESVIEDDDTSAGGGVSVASGGGGGVTSIGIGSSAALVEGSLPQRQQQSCNNNINSLTLSGLANNNNKRQINLSLPLESYKQYSSNNNNNRDVANNIFRGGGFGCGGGFSPNNNNGLAINSNSGSGCGGGGAGETWRKGSTNCTTTNNNHNHNQNCARSCSDVFVKRHSFSLRLDMSPATDGGDGGSRKALFSPDDNMEIRKRRYVSLLTGILSLRMKKKIVNCQHIHHAISI